MCISKLSEFSCGHFETTFLNGHCACPLRVGECHAGDALCPKNCGSPVSPVAFRSMLGVASDRSQVLGERSVERISHARVVLTEGRHPAMGEARSAQHNTEETVGVAQRLSCPTCSSTCAPSSVEDHPHSDRATLTRAQHSRNLRRAAAYDLNNLHGSRVPTWMTRISNAALGRRGTLPAFPYSLPGPLSLFA